MGSGAKPGGPGGDHIVIGKGQRKRLPHARPVQRRTAGVQQGKKVLEGRVGHHLQIRIGPQALKVVKGQVVGPVRTAALDHALRQNRILDHLENGGIKASLRCAAQ